MLQAPPNVAAESGLNKLINRNAPHVDGDASFATLMDLFAGESISHVVVLHDGRPTGIVSRDALAALSEPPNANTFRQEASLRDMRLAGRSQLGP